MSFIPPSNLQFHITLYFQFLIISHSLYFEIVQKPETRLQCLDSL